MPEDKTIGRVSVWYRKSPAQMVRRYRLLRRGRIVADWIRWGLVGCSSIYEEDLRRMYLAGRYSQRVVKRCPRLRNKEQDS